MIILSICLIGWIVEHRNAESWKKTASFLNKQLDSSYRAFTEQRCLMKKITVENELLKAENEELKCREERVKDFCRGDSKDYKQRVPWEAN